MELKKFLFAAAAATMLAGCSETDELALNQVAQQNQNGGIQFDVYTQRAITRAGAPGNAVDGQYGITTESLKNQAPHNVGFGVFAYYTSNSEYDTNSSTPNFMYNQQVKWDGTKQVWTYEPVKYWPNEFGDAANSDDLDKVSFFAYAPYVDVTVNTGVPVVKDGENVDSVQKKNIVGTVKNTTSGDPYIKYIVDTDPATSVDLLWGVAAEQNGYRGLNYSGVKEDGNVVPGNCYTDLTKQIGTTDSIKWNFKHALAQLNIQIISAVDTATEGNDIYTPKENATEYGTNANSKIDSLTKVYLRWIEFGGFVLKGALNLHSEDVETAGVQNAEPNWKGFDGTNELVITTVRFNDGLKDGKEGTTNNLQKNELPVALNDTIIEKSAEAEGAESWKKKHAGIPTAAYCNLFKSSSKNAKATDPIYVIPTGEELTIEMLYDVMTQDEKLAGLLSDNKTHGSAIENKITKETGVIIEAGKSYVIKIVVGLESVKFSVEVTPWQDAEPKETDVDMPFNPTRRLSLDMQGAMVLKGTNLTDVTDLTTDKRNVYFKVVGSYTDEATGKTYMKLSTSGNVGNNFVVWAEETSMIDNGTYCSPIYRQNMDDPKKPGAVITSETKLSTYPVGAFEEVKFYTARPFKVGMKGIFINAEKYIGSFEVSEGKNDPENEVHVTVKVRLNNGTVQTKSGEARKTSLLVNSGKRSLKGGNLLGYYFFQ